MLFLDVILRHQIQLSFVQFILTFGVDYAFYDGLDGNQIVMDEHKVVLVNFLDIFCDEAPLFIKHLPISNDISLASGTLQMFFFQLREILIG